MNFENHLYFIDSSALITVNRYYPLRVFPDLWKYMDGLFKRKRIFSHEVVYNEIVPASGPKDEIGKLVSKYRSAFYSITNRQGQLALEVLANFPRLIDVRAKKDEADPWIISLVIEKMEDENLFGKDSEFILVSTESEKSDTKIPAVCKYYKVNHMNLFEFFDDNHLKFSMIRREKDDEEKTL